MRNLNSNLMQSMSLKKRKLQRKLLEENFVVIKMFDCLRYGK